MCDEKPLVSKLINWLDDALEGAPEYGSVTMVVHLNENEPVRLEKGYSESLILPKKGERGMVI